MRIYLAVLAVSVLLAGCGQAFLPQRTKTKVRPAQVVGTWQYTADYGKTLITIEFKADGSFRQVVKPAGQTRQLVQTGTWKLDGASIDLEDVLTHEGFKEGKGWVPETASWDIIDSISGKPALVIFGGTHPDPDSWQEFKFIKAAAQSQAKSKR